MATFSKFQPFVEALAEKVHNLGVDSLFIGLTNTAPNSTASTWANITEIASGNGYAASGNPITISSSAQTGGTYKLVLADTTFTASGGSISTFQWAVLYNGSAANDELIGYWDSGAAQNITSGNSFVVDFDPSSGALTIA